MQETTTAVRPSRGERIMAAINRDPRTAPHGTRNDVLLAVAAAVLATVISLIGGDGSRPDALGWTLLLTANVPLAWRRRRPVATLIAVAACVAPYHALDYNHVGPVPATMVALYTVAATGTVRRTLITGGAVLGPTLIINALTDPGRALEFLRISGWIIAVLFCGIDVRYYRRYVAAIVERAERAERTREEEARRRVAEERLRIARDLHDLLAHTITLIGVQTSVAAHVLAADPDRLDRAAVAKALDDIAGTCRSARGELRTTLEVLRDLGTPDARGSLPGLHGLSDLAETARAAGARVDLTVRSGEVPPAVGAAAYRIVQEALTNAVRHGGRDGGPDDPAAGVGVRVRVYEEQDALRLRVTDDGVGVDTGGDGGVGRGGGAGDGGRATAGGGAPGFGIVGMRERARSVGGSLQAGPRDDGRGFEVSAVLPHGKDR
ncbi:histidine kinase [Streptomyces sp. Root1310]|uniref:sensor histidine kinase n=1 Tax=Streptomyces sp. Root1310 TaxID=1736452 RepID=UPI0018FE9FDE|nr:histidine kinase [Streptomyces sp. Root1310]